MLDTVPRVFIAGECIGGGDDTERLEKNGELEKQLKKVDAIGELNNQIFSNNTFSFVFLKFINIMRIFIFA